MKRVIYIFYSALLLEMWCTELFAQNFPELRFEHITVKDGLSSNNIVSIAEDKQGFIWIGTYNGLNRYDGNRFKHYFYNSTDSNSLVNNGVQSVYCDANGRLWITTKDGVSCFIPAENRFVNFSSKLNQAHYIKNNESVRVYEDAEGGIWLCNQFDVIYKVRPDFSLQEVKIDIPAFAFYNITLQGYDNIFRDKEGNEWSFKASRIYKLNKATKQPEKLFDFSSVINTGILKMIQDSAGGYLITIWNNGILKFIPEKNKLQAITAIPSQLFTDIKEWNFKNRKWFACLQANWGLYLLDAGQLSSKRYGYISSDPSSIIGNNFVQCFIDRKNNLWIASNYGINKITAEQNIFDVIPVTNPGTSNFDLMYNGMVCSFFEEDNNYWLSKLYISTFEYDSTFQLKNFYGRLFPPSGNYNFNTATAYYYYKNKNNLYITTDSGLVIYDLLNKTSVICYQQQIQPEKNLRTIVSFNENKILIRSYSGGLYVFDIAKKKFTRHFANSDICRECPSLKINYLFKTKWNEIYITTNSEGKGLYRYDRESDYFKPVKAINDKNYSMFSSDLYGIDEDKPGNLWIASSKGLYVYDPVTNMILRILRADERMGGLHKICFDSQDNAWTNGSSGIWCFIQSRNKWVCFDGRDGLPGGDFAGIITRKRDGDIVAGLEGAIAIFHPAKLINQLNEYPVVITEASVDTSIISFPLINGVSKKIRIAPGQNSFSIDFALLNYLNPASAKYYYKIMPLMKDFKLNENGHINFNGLAPGHYTLHVKGGDNAGNLYDKEDMLEINVEPRWYQTNWFKILVIMALIAIVIYFVKRRIAIIRKEASYSHSIAELKMQSLRSQLNPHFMFNSLNAIQELILMEENEKSHSYLARFSRLLRMLLENTEKLFIPLQRELDFLQLYLSLEKLRIPELEFSLTVDPAIDTEQTVIPNMILQPYIENAIWHGLSHKPTDKKLQVRITKTNGAIQYEIEDNGVGRKKSAELKSLFRKEHKSKGMELLSKRFKLLSKEFGAEIETSYEDVMNNGEVAGTLVTIKVPVNFLEEIK